MKKCVIYNRLTNKYFTYDLYGKYDWVRSIKDGFLMDSEDAEIIIPRLDKGLYEIVEIRVNE
jgi:hypothetical protein